VPPPAGHSATAAVPSSAAGWQTQAPWAGKSRHPHRVHQQEVDPAAQQAVRSVAGAPADTDAIEHVVRSPRASGDSLQLHPLAVVLHAIAYPSGIGTSPSGGDAASRLPVEEAPPQAAVNDRAAAKHQTTRVRRAVGGDGARTVDLWGDPDIGS